MENLAGNIDGKEYKGIELLNRIAYLLSVFEFKKPEKCTIGHVGDFCDKCYKSKQYFDGLEKYNEEQKMNDMENGEVKILNDLVEDVDVQTIKQKSRRGRPCILTPEEKVKNKIRSQTEYHKKRYNADPEFRNKLKKIAKENYQKVKKNATMLSDEERKIIKKKYNERYREKKRVLQEMKEERIKEQEMKDKLLEPITN